MAKYDINQTITVTITGKAFAHDAPGADAQHEAISKAISDAVAFVLANGFLPACRSHLVCSAFAEVGGVIALSHLYVGAKHTSLTSLTD